MRALTDQEIQIVAAGLRSLVGAQLQDCVQNETEIGLRFYVSGAQDHAKDQWLWFDFEARAPFVARFVGKPPTKRKAPKPLSLFVRAHLVGRRLVDVEAEESFGRIIKLHFFSGPVAKPGQEPEVCEFEARLFPHGHNAIARAGAKSVSLRPVKPIEERSLAASSSAQPTSRPPRTWAEAQAEWALERTGSVEASAAMTPAPAQSPVRSKEFKAWERAIEKKSRAIEKMRGDLAAKENAQWGRVGEWIKANGGLGDPLSWPDPELFTASLDLAKSFAWNIENCFTRAKDSARKQAAARVRLAQAERELVSLRARPPQDGALKDSSVSTPRASLFEKAEARGRTLRPAPDLDAFVGRSASDNSALLRAAQAHDLWLHLRDMPSAHAIIRRPKGRVVSDTELAVVGRWLVESSTRQSAAALSGQAFDLLVIEKRHVRPIKGDALGRVNYSNERTFRIRFD